MKRISFLTLFALPIVTQAQTFDGLIRGTIVYINQIIPILVALILLAFFWGAADFIRKTGNGEEVKEAKQRLWWGIVALFVAVAFWGVVQVLSSDLFGETPDFGAPQVDTNRINDLFPPPRNTAVTP